MGKRKGKYIPRHLLSSEEIEKQRAKDRVKYAKCQIDAGYGYVPIHDLKKDAGYGMPVGAFNQQIDSRGRVEPEGTPHTQEEIEAVKREIQARLDGAKPREPTIEERGAEIQARIDKRMAESLGDWDALVASLPSIEIEQEIGKIDETQPKQEEEKDAPQS